MRRRARLRQRSCDERRRRRLRASATWSCA